MERGEAMGKPGRAAPKRPHRGIHRPVRSGFPVPSPRRQRERRDGFHRPGERPREQRDPAGPRNKAAPSRSEHRDGADAAGLQLAGDGLRRAQGHEAGLEHRPPATADVHRDARLRSGLERTRIDVHHHLTDRAAESGGGHGWLARNTDPSPCRIHPDQGVAVRAFLGRGSPDPWLDPGCGASGSWVVLIGRDCEVPGNGIRPAELGRALMTPWRASARVSSVRAARGP